MGPLERELNNIQIWYADNPVKNASKIRNAKLKAMGWSIAALVQHTFLCIPGQVLIKPIMLLCIDWKKVEVKGPQTKAEKFYVEHLNKGFIMSVLKVAAAFISVFMNIFVGGFASTINYDYHLDLELIADTRPDHAVKHKPEQAPMGSVIKKEGEKKKKSDSFTSPSELEELSKSDQNDPESKSDASEKEDGIEVMGAKGERIKLQAINPEDV